MPGVQCPVRGEAFTGRLCGRSGAPGTAAVVPGPDSAKEELLDLSSALPVRGLAVLATGGPGRTRIHQWAQEEQLRKEPLGIAPRERMRSSLRRVAHHFGRRTRRAVDGGLLTAPCVELQQLPRAQLRASRNRFTTSRALTTRTPTAATV
ncbi:MULTISPECIES: hypothetical protein [unclassified Streptomyces]|uniref:hypothetical protein n=1 Tax=unclassified Streptomyces TaxID=2593676 RepID=UPI003800783A